ncbi:porin [Undibacterium fentianense]|uniref:Porin n=1 Tax=Undibacterium fentianense TaxID=2828728 RepID=A0A941E296_9BURK|nr:porin [Undibacterium fentianense]MBR7799661.1 porin [Undibacterium fentianense]
MKARYVYPLVLASIALAPFAQADDLSDWLKIDGFGTLGTYKGSSDVAGVRTEQRQRVVSYTDWRFDGDSQASIQATLNPHGKLKAVVQLISKKDVAGSNKPTVEWAYVAYPVTNEIDLKVGRTVAPIFMLSDYRNLNYAQTAVRPQSEIYQVNPITYQDGATARWDKKLGAGNVQLEGFFGKTKVSVAGGDVDLSRVKGLSLKYAQDSWSVRGGYSWYDASLKSVGVEANLKTLMSLPAAACANCATEIAAVAPIKGITATIKTLGAGYDDGEWIAQAEWAKRETNSVVIVGVSGWNVLGARRIGDFTPYVGFGSIELDGTKSNLTPGPFAPAALKAQLNYLNQSFIGTGDSSRDVLALGVRWDFAKNLALKAQIERTKLKSPAVGASNGYYSYETSMLGKPNGFDGRVSMFTLNLDFVF